MKKYLIHLEGQGDEDIFFVTEEQFAWIHDTYPDEMPPSWSEPIPGTTGLVANLTIGSFENDRALHLSAAASVRYDSIKSAKAAAKRQGWTIVDTYSGHIY